MTELVALLALLPLDILPPPTSPSPTATVVYVQHGHGFAAYIVGGFFALGLLVVAAILISRRPKRIDPPGNEQ